jgi:signal transduction histidine kinase
LAQAELLQPTHAKASEQIARSAQRMNRLIGDLLDASALNAGKLTLDRRTHAVADLVREAVEMFRTQAETHGVRLTDNVVEPPAFVSCDSDRIVQVLSNLIGNGIKFTPRGGTVSVAAQRTNGAIELEVADTGRGIPSEQVPHLFDRFWRGKAHRDGAGLGLFIARGIIASHGGTLALDTTRRTGSRFFFRLPEVTP